MPWSAQDYHHSRGGWGIYTVYARGILSKTAQLIPKNRYATMKTQEKTRDHRIKRKENGHAGICMSRVYSSGDGRRGFQPLPDPVYFRKCGNAMYGRRNGSFLCSIFNNGSNMYRYRNDRRHMQRQLCKHRLHVRFGGGCMQECGNRVIET